MRLAFAQPEATELRARGEFLMIRVFADHLFVVFKFCRYAVLVDALVISTVGQHSLVYAQDVV